MDSSPTTKITVLDTFSVSPPPHSVAAPPLTLPLTFLDIPWLLLAPSQPLFFYNLPNTTTPKFTSTILPNLIHSLSLSLKHFFPLSAKLDLSSEIPCFHCTQSDSVSFTIAEAKCSDLSSIEFFNYLIMNNSRKAQDFHDLVPAMNKRSVLAIQVTIFPECGISVGFNLHNVVADGRTFHNFLKCWGAFCKYGEVNGACDVALVDSSVISDPIGLRSILLQKWRQHIGSSYESNSGLISDDDLMRATFEMGPIDIEKIKKRITDRSVKIFGSAQFLLSPYVVVCAYVWVCWAKAYWASVEDFRECSKHYFGFIAGGITRLDYNVPSNYVGNCVAFGRAEVMRSDLVGPNGVVHAAKAIGDAITRLNGDVLGGAKNWIDEWKELCDSDFHVMVTGSPKTKSYGLDFGWGRPAKIEEVSIDKTRAISLCESRKVVGGMEIGLTLPKTVISDFEALYIEGLNVLRKDV